ncbi:MAG: WD40 repeat domain-containing protein [Gemmataceae bacterium]
MALAVTPPAANRSSEVARASAEHAISLLTRGELASGLHRLVQTLELTPATDTALERAVRLNLTAWFPSLYALRDVLPVPGSVAAMATRPDRRAYRLAVYRAEKHRGEAQLIDAGTLTPLAPPFGAGSPIRAVGFGLDGVTAVTGTEDGMVRLWNATTGTPVGLPMSHRSLLLPAFAVATLGAAPAGPLAATWVAFHAQEAKRSRYDRAVAVFNLAPHTLVTVSSDATMWRWDAARGTLVRTFRLGPGSARAAALSPNGSAIAVAYSALGAWPGDLSREGRVQVWDVETGRPLTASLPHPAGVNAVAFHPSGQRLVTGADDKLARVWHLRLGDQFPAIELQHDQAVQTVAYSPDGRRLLTGTGAWLGQRAVGQVWDATTGRRLGNPLPHTGLVSAASFQSDGEGVVTASHDGAVRRWGGAGESRPLSRLPHPGRVNAVAFGPGGAVTGGEDGTVRLWSARAAEEASRPQEHGSPIQTLCFLRDGRVAACGADRTVRFWDLAAQQVEQPALTAADSGRITAIAAAPDGSLLATGGTDGCVHFWTLPGCARDGEFKVGPDAVVSVNFSPEGSQVLVGTTGGQARIWSVRDKRPVGAAIQLPAPVRAARYSPDGKTVLVADDQKQAVLYQPETGRPIGRPISHSDFVLAVCFAPDGRTAVTGGADGVVQLWDVATWMRVGPPLRHPGSVRSVAIDSSGGLILAGSGDGASVWSHPQPARGDAAELKRRVQVETGMELRGDNVLESLSPAEWIEQSRKRE